MKAWTVNKYFDLERRPCLTLRIASESFLNDEILDGRELDLSLKEYRKKRSLSANRYMWSLINQIASVMRLSQDEVYHKMLCDYGTLMKDEDGNIPFMRVKADTKLTGWLFIHTKWLNTFMGKNGKTYTEYALIKGSSEYDTKEMSVLLDGIISEAKELNIETMTEEELSSLRGYECRGEKR